MSFVNKTVFAETIFAKTFSLSFLALSLTVLSLTVLLSGFANAISSSEAQEKIGVIVGSEAKEILSLSKPLEVGASRYWVFFYSIYSSKRILGVVDDDDGSIVENEDRLKAVGKTVYEYGVTQEYLKKNSWNFGAIEPVMASVINVLSENERKLADLTSSVEQRYPTLSFRKIEANLNSLTEQAFALETALQDGISLEQIFENEYTDSSLYQLITQYNNTLTLLNEFSNHYDEYRKTISEVQSQAYKANITDPDYTSINTNLERLREIGFSSLYEKLKKEKPASEFNKLLSEERENTWIADGIASFQFKKNYYDANNAFKAQQNAVEQTIAAEQILSQCGISVTQLKKDWSEVKYLMNKGSSTSYAKAIQKMPLIEAQVQSITEKYEACLNPPRSRSATRGIDYSTAIAALLVIAIAATSYWYWKKKKEEEQY